MQTNSSWTRKIPNDWRMSLNERYDYDSWDCRLESLFYRDYDEWFDQSRSHDYGRTFYKRNAEYLNDLYGPLSLECLGNIDERF